jgi:hypothetical protein
MPRHHFVTLHQLLASVREVPHDRQEEAVHQPSRCGRGHPVCPAFKELLMQLLLQLGDLHAQGRLHDIQSLGCARDGAVLEQGDEILNLLQVHKVGS